MFNQIQFMLFPEGSWAPATLSAGEAAIDNGWMDEIIASCWHFC